MKKAEIEEGKGSVIGKIINFLKNRLEAGAVESLQIFCFIGENRTIIRPPDAKGHALDIEKIQALINQKEIQFVSFYQKFSTSHRTISAYI